MNQKFRRLMLHVAALLLAAVTFAPSAFAVDALFSGTVNRFQYGYFTTFATLPGTGWPQPVAAVQDGAASAASFAIPSNAFDGGSFSYTAAFPGYPYFKAYRDRWMTAGAFAKSFKVPGTSYTIMRPNVIATSQYPNALPTTPNAGLIRVKAGPQGFGGFWGVRDEGFIIGTLASLGGGGGYSDFYFRGLTGGAVAGLPNGIDNAGPTQTLCCQFSRINNQTNPTQTAGLIGVHVGGVGHITGTVTVSGPIGGYATVVTYTGMDGRTGMGTNGTLSMVAPTLVMNYTLANQPTFDQTTLVTGLNTESPGVVKTTLTFLPEPSQVAMLAAGSVGLLGLVRLQRRK